MTRIKFQLEWPHLSMDSFEVQEDGKALWNLMLFSRTITIP